MSKKLLLVAVSISAIAIVTSSPAVASGDAELKALRAEISAMRQIYESKINQLEKKVEQLESKQIKTAAKVAENKEAVDTAVASVPAQPQSNANSFNPEVSAVLQGKYQSFSSKDSDFAGFGVGEEGERSQEGFGLDETELNLAANVDDKFRGSTTIALENEAGDTNVGVEEAYVETTSLPYGLQAKAGRFFSELGYLNSHHTHVDDFADRPLTNRAFLGGSYGDDGMQISAILPTVFYSEIGGGIYRGDDFPAGGASGSRIGAWTAYGRIGGDVGDKTNWRLGLSTLQSNDITRATNDDTVTFKGDSNLYIADARLVYAPTGNNANKEITLQGEYFYRNEDGSYNDTNAETGDVAYNDAQSGWYAQGVYKFHPQWRVGARYSRLYAGDVPAGLVGSALDDSGHNPRATSAMLDWTNSEFSRVRVQYNHEELKDGQNDNQFTLQYIMSIGAHGAHSY